MKIVVKFFAILRDRANLAQTEIELPAGATVVDALQRISQEIPALGAFLPRVATAVNQAYSRSDTELKDGDELALIPPVSGG